MPTPVPSVPRSAICAALLLTQITACMTWGRVPGPLDQQVGAEPIAHARVKLRDGSEMPLRNVTVGADSVIGYSEGSGERRAQPVTRVASIDRRQLSAQRTTAVVIGTTALGIAIAVSSIGFMGNSLGSMFGW